MPLISFAYFNAQRASAEGKNKYSQDHYEALAGKITKDNANLVFVSEVAENFRLEGYEEVGIVRTLDKNNDETHLNLKAFKKSDVPHVHGHQIDIEIR